MRVFAKSLCANKCEGFLALGYTLSPFPHSIKVSIPFYLEHFFVPSVRFFFPIFRTRSFYRQSLRRNVEHYW